MKARTIFFVGKPGCGKDTQAELLSKATGWPIMSMGEQLRKLAAEDTLFGQKVKRDLESGVLAPDWVAMHRYLTYLLALPAGSDAIFDGFPRELSQAELVEESLTWLERPYTVLHIAVSDETVRERLAHRAKTSGRADDRAVEERLAEYRARTEPAIQFFRARGALIEVDGEPKPEVIAADIKKKLKIA